jgi:hypothetical protein
LARRRAYFKKNLREDNKYFPFFSKSEDLGVLSVAVALYLDYAFWIPVLNFIAFILFSPTLYFNWKASEGLGYGPIARLSITGVTTFSTAHAVAAVLTFNVGIVFCLIVFFRQRNLARKIQTRIATTSHYSVLIKGIPSNSSEEQVREFFGSVGQVVDCVLVRSNSVKLVEFTRQLQNRERSLLILRAKAEKRSSFQEKLEKAEADFAKLHEKYQHERDTPSKCAGYAFVTFQRTVDAKSMIEEHRACCCGVDCTCNKADTRIEDARLIARHAPEPSNTNYQNYVYGGLRRFGYAIGTWLLSGLAQTPFTGAIVALYRLQGDLSGASLLSLDRLYALLATIAIVISNQILAALIRLSVRILRFRTRTEEEFYIMICTYSIQLSSLATSIYYCTSGTMDNFLMPEWVAAAATSLLSTSIVMGLLSPLLVAFAPGALIIRLFTAKIATVQEQLDQAYEPPDYPLSLRYVASILLQYLSWVYGPIFPPLFLIVGLSLTLNFFADRYMRTFAFASIYSQIASSSRVQARSQNRNQSL